MEPQQEGQLIKKKKRIKVNNRAEEEKSAENSQRNDSCCESSADDKTSTEKGLKLTRGESEQSSSPSPVSLTAVSNNNEDLYGETPPKPLSRTRNDHHAKLEKKEISVMVTPKKRKASKILSNVLKREKKKGLQVTTIFKEKNENELKDEKIIDSSANSPNKEGPTKVDVQLMFVQSKNGFHPGGWDDVFGMCKNITHSQVSSNRYLLIHAAISFHKKWTRFMTFCHGILAGIACCHILSVSTTLTAANFDSKKFVEFYHFLSLKIHFLVFVFTTMSIVSCYDRLDVITGSFHRLSKGIFMIFITALYLFCMVLTLVSHPYTVLIDTLSDIEFTTFKEWHWLVTTRDVLLVVAWIFLSIFKPKDILNNKLHTIKNKYIEKQ